MISWFGRPLAAVGGRDVEVGLLNFAFGLFEVVPELLHLLDGFAVVLLAVGLVLVLLVDFLELLELLLQVADSAAAVLRTPALLPLLQRGFVLLRRLDALAAAGLGQFAAGGAELCGLCHPLLELCLLPDVLLDEAFEFAHCAVDVLLVLELAAFQLFLQLLQLLPPLCPCTAPHLPRHLAAPLLYSLHQTLQLLDVSAEGIRLILPGLGLALLVFAAEGCEFFLLHASWVTLAASRFSSFWVRLCALSMAVSRYSSRLCTASHSLNTPNNTPALTPTLTRSGDGALVSLT